LSVSLHPAQTLLSYPLAILVPLALLGLFGRQMASTVKLLHGSSLVAFGAIFIVGSVLTPITRDFERYILAFVPSLVASALSGADLLKEALKGRGKLLVLVGALLYVLYFVVVPAGAVALRGFLESRNGYTLDVILEKDLADIINRIAQSGDVVLVYEVQDRLFLRPDIEVLSLDGITDGKVAPYLRSGRLDLFLKKYRPALWIANDAVFYRPYLKKSLLNEALVNTPENGSRVTIDGITFERIATRTYPVPEGFAGWKAIYKLSYLDD